MGTDSGPDHGVSDHRVFGGRNIILSIRHPEAERRRRKRLEETLRGDVVSGTVVSLRDFGAFVDIGGVQGLLPVSEIGWERVTDINERLTVGQVLEVAITKLDWENGRISLSLKSTLADPWDEVRSTYPEGTIQRGVVVRLTPFGAFVNLGPGVDGLLHVSKLGKGKRIAHPRDAVGKETPGGRIDAIDGERKRISLPLATEEAADQDRPGKRRPVRMKTIIGSTCGGGRRPWVLWATS